MHLFKTRMISLLRNRTILFWSLIFPILLATLYNLAFANIMNGELIETIDIAIVESDDMDQELLKVIDETTFDNDVKLFNASIGNRDNAYKLLDDNDVIGIIEIIDGKLSFVVNNSGLDQTITKSFLDEYLQTTNAFTNLIVIGSGNIEEISNDLFKNVNYIDEIAASRNRANYILIYYFALIGMAIIYAGFWGTDNIINLQANMSGKAVRIAVSPVNRLKTLIIYTLCALIIHIMIIIILLFYLIGILGLDFGDKLLLIFLVCVLGSLVGISFGSFVAISLKKAREGTKVLITTIVGVLGGFLSGMMVPDMKYIIQTKFPIINYINPVAIISDSLYSLNYYGASSRFFINLVILIFMTIIFTIGTYLFYRRDSYESI